MDQIEIIGESTATQKTLLSSLRRVLLAAIGVVVLTQEQIEEFLNSLVERGEIADGDARNLLNDLVENRKRMVQDGARKAESEVEGRIETLLSRMNIPSRSEIDSLAEKIDSLSAKVDQLKKLS
jgi:poly(hydroxyalkanoate) granule-associated protein